jgi:hypothetical protein
VEGDSLSLIFVKPTKEYAYRRKANKNHVCRECHSRISVGEHYVEDHLSRVYSSLSGGRIRWFVWTVCENCWKAPINV